MKAFSLTIAMLGALAFAVSGCSAPDSDPAADNGADTNGTPATVAVNDRCPMMGGKVTADGGSTVWKGKTIGFCCPECIDKWSALSDEEKQAKLDAAKEGGDAHQDHGDHEGHGSHDAPDADKEHSTEDAKHGS